MRHFTDNCSICYHWKDGTCLNLYPINVCRKRREHENDTIHYVNSIEKVCKGEIVQYIILNGKLVKRNFTLNMEFKKETKND